MIESWANLVMFVLLVVALYIIKRFSSSICITRSLTYPARLSNRLQDGKILHIHGSHNFFCYQSRHETLKNAYFSNRDNTEIMVMIFLYIICLEDPLHELGKLVCL